MLSAHTVPKFGKAAGPLAHLNGFDALPRDRQIELLALFSKIRRRRDVDQCEVSSVGADAFVAFAVVHNTLVEKRSVRLEEALHDLYVEIRNADQQRRAAARARTL